MTDGEVPVVLCGSTVFDVIILVLEPTELIITEVKMTMLVDARGDELESFVPVTLCIEVDVTVVEGKGVSLLDVSEVVTGVEVVWAVEGCSVGFSISEESSSLALEVGMSVLLDFTALVSISTTFSVMAAEEGTSVLLALIEAVFEEGTSLLIVSKGNKVPLPNMELRSGNGKKSFEVSQQLDPGGSLISGRLASQQ